jgi:hypothetical protein
MSNWCTNRLEVYGPTDEVERFKDTVQSSTLDTADILDGKDQVTYSFESPEVPLAWVSSLAEKFSKLSVDISYYNLSRGYAGEVLYKDGTLRSITELDCSDMEQYEDFLVERFDLTPDELNLSH